MQERSYSRHIILKGRDSETTHVRDIMKTDVVCCNVEEKLDTIVSVLSEYGIRHLPVLEGAAMRELHGPAHHVLRLSTPASTLRGVLSIKDCVWMVYCLVRNELQGRGCAAQCIAHAIQRADAPRSIGQITVSDILPDRQTKQHVPFAINAHKSVLDAIRLMAQTDQHALCVLNDAKELVGIVTARAA